VHKLLSEAAAPSFGNARTGPAAAVVTHARLSVTVSDALYGPPAPPSVTVPEEDVDDVGDGGAPPFAELNVHAYVYGGEPSWTDDAYVKIGSHDGVSVIVAAAGKNAGTLLDAGAWHEPASTSGRLCVTVRLPVYVPVCVTVAVPNEFCASPGAGVTLPGPEKVQLYVRAEPLPPEVVLE
jgi:hypothetical protein